MVGSKETREKEEKRGMGEEERGEEVSVNEMKAWEQHWGVISIPRYDYKAPSSLLHTSSPAFLITCPIKREKSATKEAISIFEKIIKLYYTQTSECVENNDEAVAAKRRKICDGELGKDCSVNEANNNASSVETNEQSCQPTPKSDLDSSSRFSLSLVKLTKSGLLLFTVPKNDFPNVTDIVSHIFRCLEIGQLSSPSWCHRILPIQATCRLNEKELQTVLSKLVKLFVNDNQDKLQRPVKFAIGYDRRGVDETEMKTSRKFPKDTEELALLDRNKCFSVVAATIKEILPDSVVDLKFPELSVLVEVLPISGISNGSLIVGVAVLPHNLIATKQRLCIKPLLSDAKTKKGKQK